LFAGIGTAQFTEPGRIQILAVLFFHLQLDGQAVAIPARHIGRIEAGQRLGLDDDVLEYLVDRMANVDVAVGIGRAVMQDELGPPGGLLAYALVALLLLPVPNPARLPLGQVTPHGERSVGQVQGVLVISHVGCGERRVATRKAPSPSKQPSNRPPRPLGEGRGEGSEAGRGPG